MKDKLTERKRTGLTGVRDGQAAVGARRKEDAGAAQGGDTGGPWRTCNRVGVGNQREEEREDKMVQHLKKVKLVAILPPMRRKTTYSYCYHGDSGADGRPQLP